MIKCWLDAGWYSVGELQRAVVELKEAIKETEKEKNDMRVKQKMVEEHIKKVNEK
jgi:hypothetical protein